METQLYTEYVPSDSSAFEGLTYDANSQRLFVHFHSGTTAGYEGVSQAVFNELKNSSSQGSYYARWIKPYHRGVNSDVNYVPRQKAAETVETPEPAETFRFAAIIEFRAENFEDASDFLNDLATERGVTVSGVARV